MALPRSKAHASVPRAEIVAGSIVIGRRASSATAPSRARSRSMAGVRHGRRAPPSGSTIGKVPSAVAVATPARRGAVGHGHDVLRLDTAPAGPGRMQDDAARIAGREEYRHVLGRGGQGERGGRPGIAPARIDVGEALQRHQAHAHQRRDQHHGQDETSRAAHGGVPYHSHGACFVIVDVVVAAGGQGRRLGGAVAKQWLTLGDHTISSGALRRAPSTHVRGIVAVVPAGDLEPARALAAAAAGGKSDRGRGWRGPQAGLGGRGGGGVPDDADVVLVHDAARPFVSHAVTAGSSRRRRATGGIAAAPRARHGQARRPDGQSRWIDGPSARRTGARADAAGIPARRDRRVLLPVMTSPIDVTDEAALAERLGHRVRWWTGIPTT